MIEGAAPFTIRVEATPDSLSLTITGELDMATKAQLLQTVRANLGQRRSVTLDLASLEFCDSVGINALVASRQFAEQTGATFAIAVASPQVRRVLELSGTADYLGLSAVHDS